MEAQHKRILRAGSEYERYFPAQNLHRTDPVLTRSGDVFDTLVEMARIVRKTLADTRAIAPVLRGETPEGTLRNLWEFVYRHIQYTPDKEGVEQLRRPLRTWADREAGVDCDCYAIFLSSVLTNLGISHSFRMTKYGGRESFQHVYVVVPKPGAADAHYALDCVVDAFGKEVPYSAKHDKMMPIQYLNGLGQAPAPMHGPIMAFGQEFRGMGRLAGLGSVTQASEDFLQRLKLHLQNTRDLLKANPQAVRGGERLRAHLDFLLANWDHPANRAEALRRLGEMERVGLNGLGGFFSSIGNAVKQATGWVGDKVSAASTAVADASKQAAAWTGDKLQDAGEAIVKYNPVSVAVRNGLLLAFKINLFRMAERLGYGYWSEEQARAKGLDVGEWRKLKERLERVIKIHQGLQGDLESLKKNILEGWEHGTKKHGLLRGLGEPVTATAGTAAASGVIATVLAFLRDVDWGKLLGRAGDALGQEYEKAGQVPEGYKYPESEEQFRVNQEYYAKPHAEAEPGNSMLLYVGLAAGAVGLYLATKKK